MNIIADQAKGIRNILWTCDTKVYGTRFYRVDPNTIAPTAKTQRKPKLNLI